MKFLAILFILLTPAWADQLEEEVEKLATNFEKLEGYQASYEAETQDGKKGLFEVGVDFKSGWAYLILDFKKKDGTPLHRMEQWATGEGELIIKGNDEATVYEGLGKLMERLNAFQKLFKKEGEFRPFQISAMTYLTEDQASTTVGLGKVRPAWLKNIDAVVDSDDEKVRLDWGKNGIITVDRKNGFLNHQEIIVEGGKRTLKLVKWKKNPGAAAIAKRFTPPLEDVPRKDIVESGMSKDLLRISFQIFLVESAKPGSRREDLDEFLKVKEEEFVTYLGSEPLDGPELLKKEQMMETFEKVLDGALKSAEKRGKKIDPAVAFQDVKFRNNVEITFAEGLVKNIPPAFKMIIQKTLFGERLQAEGVIQVATRKIIEDFLEKCYFRAMVRRTAEDFFKEK